MHAHCSGYTIKIGASLMIVRLVICSLFVGIIGALTACGAPQKKQVEAGPPIPGVNLSGAWYSTEFGDIQLVQAGLQVTGKYEDRRGPDHNGHFRGTLQGDLFRLTWVKPGNVRAAIEPRKGRAWLRVSRDGKNLSGRWGFDESEDDGGVWNAEKSKYD